MQRAAQATVSLVAAAQRGIADAFDVSRVGVLRAVAQDGPLRPAAIGSRQRMARSSVTRHVQALQDAGQVDVVADPQDGRTCLVSATDAGRAELDQIDDIGGAAFAAVVADWTDEDLEALTRLLGRLQQDWAERGRAARRSTTPAQPPRWRHPVSPEEPT